jgi:hypothetical protein
MIKVHKIENGDIIKILPIISDNEILPFKAFFVTSFSINNKIECIYDDSGKDYLKRISHRQRFILNIRNPIIVQSRYYLNIFIENEIRILNIGKQIFDLIKNNAYTIDPRSNHLLHIVKDEKSGFPNFTGSYTKEVEWKPPVKDINSKYEWEKIIKSKKFDEGSKKSMYDTYIENNNIFNRKEFLIKHLGSDLLSDIIRDDREKRLKLLEI